MKRLKIVAAKFFKTNSARSISKINFVVGSYFKKQFCCWKIFQTIHNIIRIEKPESG